MHGEPNILEVYIRLVHDVHQGATNGVKSDGGTSEHVEVQRLAHSYSIRW